MKRQDVHPLWKQKWQLIAGGLLGMAGGFLYYRYIGCIGGGCPITANPYTSMIYGGVIGVLIGFVLKPPAKEQEGNPDA